MTALATHSLRGIEEHPIAGHEREVKGMVMVRDGKASAAAKSPRTGTAAAFRGTLKGETRS